jgi:Cu(I)/Ag(I) efflux system membrane protein CusA/SilA
MHDVSEIAGEDPSRSFIARVIGWSVHNQLIVLILTAALTVAGVLAIDRTPLDAIPDLSDTQVIIRTEFAGQATQIVEDLVTYPLSTSLLGLPKTKAVRGFSMFGTSFVYVIFQDEVDDYWARSRVAEALVTVQKDLPENATPRLGPDATGVGWIYQYALVDRTGRYDLAELRALQDWFLRFELATVPGVSEVAAVGGFVREYQVLIDPNRLRAYDIPLVRVRDAVKAASMEVGGRVLEQAETELMIRSRGYVSSLEDLQQVVVRARNGTPVLLMDVARVLEGPELRRGVVELDGEGEVVGGIVAIIMLPLGVLGAFTVMSAQGITANIMSLGGIAIAIGAMVDASIVMVENAHRRLSDMPDSVDQKARNTAILQSAKEVGPGLFFSLLIITVFVGGYLGVSYSTVRRALFVIVVSCCKGTDTQ